MFHLKATLLAISILSLGGVSARADTGLESLPIGSIVKGTAQFGKRQLPLLAGEWQLVARERRIDLGGCSGVPRVALYLVQIENGIFSKAIRADTNLEPCVGGWTRHTGICDRSDVLHAVFDRNYNNKEAECWIINHVGTTLAANALQVDKDFYRFTDDKRRPKTALVLNYFLVSGFDFLTLAYGTNPELAGFEPTPTADWRGNSWHRDVIQQDPKRVAFVQQLKVEGEKLLPLVKAGMRGGLPPGTVVSVGGNPPTAQVNTPSPASSSDKTADPAERMRQLKRLFDEKLITQAEYEERRRKILDGM